MTNEEKTKCHVIIHATSAAAGGIGFGLAQIPTSDAVPLSGIQVLMVVNLGLVFGKTITKPVALGMISAFMASVARRAASQGILGWIPGFGNLFNAGTAFTLTEAIGWYAANEFANDKELEERREAEQKKLEAEKKTVEAQTEASESAALPPDSQPKKERELTTNEMFAVISVFSILPVVICGIADLFIMSSLLRFISGIIISAALSFLLYVTCNRKDIPAHFKELVTYSNVIACILNGFYSLARWVYASDAVRSMLYDILAANESWIVKLRILYYLPGFNLGILVMALIWMLMYEPTRNLFFRVAKKHFN